MDPLLIAAIRELRKKLREVPDATRAEKDEFLRVKTNGKYGFSDYIRAVASVDTDAPGNVGRSAAQGALMEFADEFSGMPSPSYAAAKIGTPPPAKMGTEEFRLRDEMYSSAHPVESAIARLSGAMGTGLLVPGGQVSSVGQAMARGGAIGGAAGAATALGAGEDRSMGETAVDMAQGGGIGMVAGAVLPALLGSTKLAMSPAARAERRLAHAVKESGGPGALQKQLSEHVAAGRGDDVMLGDLSDRVRAEADFAANNSDDVMVPLAQTVRARQADMSDRLLQDAKGALGADPNASARLEALRDARLAWANSDEGFAGLRERGRDLSGKVGDFEGVTLPLEPSGAKLADILNQPKIRTAWREAQKAGLIGNELDTGTPSFEKLQNVKFDLDDAVGVAFRNGRVNLAKRLKEGRDALVQELEERVPGYKAANAKYQQMLKQEEALEAGVAAWNVNDSQLLAQQVKKLGPTELSEFRYGMASSLLNQLRNAQTNRDVASQLLNRSKTLDEKLKVVFGTKEKFDEFMQRVASEGDLAKMKGALGNSATARRLSAAGFDPAELGINAVTGGPANALVNAGAQMGRGALARRTAAQLGPSLMMRGAPDIEALLAQWGSRRPLLGAGTTSALPAAMPSLWNQF